MSNWVIFDKNDVVVAITDHFHIVKLMLDAEDGWWSILNEQETFTVRDAIESYHAGDGTFCPLPPT